MTTLDVVTGFLGAGKTTFLARYSHWLEAQGISYCIIENEFGRAGVDGAMLMQGGARVKEISGGCVCCTLKVTLHDMLLDLSGEVQRVVLEPSGLFCGDDLLDILHSPELEGKVRLGMWTGILDPLCVAVLQREDRAVLQSELYAAGSVVLSKAQLCSEKEIADAKQLLDELLPEDPPLVLAEPWDRYADDEWFEALQATGACLRTHARRRFDHQTMFQSATIAPKRVYSLMMLRFVMSMVLSGKAGMVLRVKGVVKAEDHSMWRVNCTPGCVEMVPQKENGEPMLNVIGRQLNRAELRKILEGTDDE